MIFLELSSWMEQSRNKLRYLPLSTLRPEIRTLVLEPSPNPAAPLHCLLQHIFLDITPIPAYETLSYAWGDASVTSPIYLHGGVFQATVNLVAALRAIRNRFRRKTLWVDAICINQSDKKERERQVAMMGDIYRLGWIDFLWLGIQPLEVVDLLPVLRYNYNPTLDTAANQFTRLVPSSKSKLWPQVMRIFDSAVWQRMWIMQELALAAEVHVLIGSENHNWNALDAIANALLTPHYLDDIPPKTRRRMGTVQTVTNLWRKRPQGLPGQTSENDLLDVWFSFGWCLCFDPRDKIFALLNIVPNHLGIRPDYTQTAQQLYCRFTKAYIRQNRNLKIIAYCSQSLGVNPDPTITNGKALLKSTTEEYLPVPNDYCLPTWTPDFGSDQAPKAAGFFLYRMWEGDVQPDIPWSEAATRLFDTDDKITSISFLGISIDRITRVAESTRGASPKQKFEYYRNIYQSLAASIPPDSEYLPGEPFEVSFWRTLVCNRYRVNRSNYDTEILKWGSEPMNLWRKGVQHLLKSTANVQRLNTDMAQAAKYAHSRRTFKVLETAALFIEHFYTVGEKYSFCTTERGNLALVPDTSRPGDELCGLCGGFGPSVLRPIPGKEAEDMSWIGPAYVHRFDLLSCWNDRHHRSDRKERKFVLI